MTMEIYIYIRLRMSRDGTRCACVRSFVWNSGVSYARFIQFALGSFYAVHISVLRKEEDACSINTIPYDSVKNSHFSHVYFCYARNFVTDAMFALRD